MMLMNQENWETIKHRLMLIWDNEILDRPCVSVKCAKGTGNRPGNRPAPGSPEEMKDFYLNPERILERNVQNFENTYFGGDSFPVVFPYWGCSGHIKYLFSQEQFDQKVAYSPQTIWIDPLLNDYDTFNFCFSKDNPVFQAELQTMKMLAEYGKGKFFVAMPDNCGSYDGLAAIRGNETFLFDLLEEPEQVKKAGNQVIDLLIESGDMMIDALRETNDGGSLNGWFSLWSPGKMMQLQCDLSCMISPDLFQDFIVEELERTTEWLDHSVYHLDGQEQARFLDMILGVKNLNMIQWTQVAGQPDVTHQFHHLDRIQKAGKGILLFIKKAQLDAVLNHTSPYGRMLCVEDAANPQEADDIVNYVSNHSFCKKYF